MNCYFGIDIGSISTKAVLIDDKYNILDSCYIETNANPIEASKIVANKMTIPPNYVLKGIGTTGSARKLIGLMLGAGTIKNEITAHAVGTMHFYPDARTILEIGGQDSKVILLDKGRVKDYAMNTLCAAGTGAFLSGQAKRLGLNIEDIGGLALRSEKPASIAARCTVFAETDLIHKAQIGYKKEDIVAGLCKAIVQNYLNNVCKGKKIESPIIFQGGVSKNIGVLHFFKEILGTDIITNPNGHLMGAIGAAILSSKDKNDREYSLDIKELEFQIEGDECRKCSNNCELLHIYKNRRKVDIWGSKCGNI